jgi:hypothetical protein
VKVFLVVKSLKWEKLEILIFLVPKPQECMGENIQYLD